MICTHCYNYIHNNYIIIILLLNCVLYRTLLNGPEGDHIMIQKQKKHRDKLRLFYEHSIVLHYHFTQLYNKRETVAKSNKERSHWKQIDYRYMTEESSDEDGHFKSPSLLGIPKV